VQIAVPPDAIPLDVDFEQGISLAGYEAEVVEGGLQVTLWWQPAATPDGDYTVFVHLIDANGAILSQKDARPQWGLFDTRWWRAGDIIPDPRIIPLDGTISLDQQGLALRIGLYPTGGGPNLPRVTAPMGEEDFVVTPLQLE
jgi:hypothetical protein